MSGTQTQPDEEPVVYAIRFYERAKRDMDAIVVYLAENIAESVAVDWYAGINKAISSLATLPERYAVAPEPHFKRTTRNLTWARPKSRASHRIIYQIVHEGPDGPTVIVLHVRGATMAPITSKEAREIEAQQ